MDLRNEKVGFKIREHTLQRVPYLLVAGDKRSQGELVSVRTRSGKDLGHDVARRRSLDGLRAEVESRGRTVLEGLIVSLLQRKRVRRNEEITARRKCE